MHRIFWIFIISLIVLSLACSSGCGARLELPEIPEGAEVESSGASERAGFLIAETPEGEKVNIIVTAMDEAPSKDNLLMYIVTTATDDARSQGEEASFDITNASQEAEPHDPTIIIYTSTQSGNKIYAGWYCDIEKELFIVSLSGSDSSFIQSIKCHSTE